MKLIGVGVRRIGMFNMKAAEGFDNPNKFFDEVLSKLNKK